jgi:hypothetical protein
MWPMAGGVSALAHFASSRATFRTGPGGRLLARAADPGRPAPRRGGAGRRYRAGRTALACGAPAHPAAQARATGPCASPGTPRPVVWGLAAPRGANRFTAGSARLQLPMCSRLEPQSAGTRWWRLSARYRVHHRGLQRAARPCCCARGPIARGTDCEAACGPARLWCAARCN